MSITYMYKMDFFSLLFFQIALIGLTQSAAPIITNLPRTIYIAETYDGNKDILQVGAFDPDGRKVDKGDTTISVSPNPAPHNRFDVKNNGVIEFDSPCDFDYLVTPVWTIEACVVDEGMETACEDLTVNILQATWPPILSNVPNTITVNEDTAAGTSIYQVSAYDADGDTINYVMTENPVCGCFSISGGGRIELDTARDYESDPIVYELSITIDDGRFTVATEILTVNIGNINEAPTLDNMPTVETFREDTSAGTDVYRIQASDLDGDTLSWTLVSSPEQGPFIVDTATDDKEAHIYFNNNPGFDFETLPKYYLTFFASDGISISPPETVVVEITNTNEPPYFTNMPGITSVQEDTVGDVVLYQVAVSDSDIGDTFSFSITAVVPSEGLGKFDVDATSGKVGVTSTPGFDFEGINQYIVTIEASDANGLTDYETLTVDIENSNEPPTFALKQQIVSINEQRNVTYILDMVSIIATDVDGNDSLTYTLEPTPNSDYFRLDAGPVLVVNKIIDYENPYHPVIFPLEITVVDGNGMDDVMYVIVNIDDINDNSPAFYSQSYSAKVTENVLGDVDLVLTSAFDPDSGLGGVIKYSLLENASLSYFSMDEDSGLLLLKSPIDREALSGWNFTAVATDGYGLTGTASILISVQDVNDNRPSLSKAFFSFEVRSDAPVAEFIGDLDATDPDSGTIYPLNFKLSVSTRIFDLEESTGHLSVSEALLQETDYEPYVLTALVQDIRPPKYTSEYKTIRVDTYSPCECLLNIELAIHPSNMSTTAQREAFRTNLGQITYLTGSLPKLVYINDLPAHDFFASQATTNDTSTVTVVTVLFVKSSLTDSATYLQSRKEFHKVPELLAVMLSKDGSSTGANMAVLSTVYPVVTVSAYQECEWQEPLYNNWWLETPEGLATTCVLSTLLGLIVLGLMTLAAYYLYKYFAGKSAVRSVNSSFLPQKTQPRPVNDGEFDFRHNSRDKAYEFRSQSSKAGPTTVGIGAVALATTAVASLNPQLKKEVSAPDDAHNLSNPEDQDDHQVLDDDDYDQELSDGEEQPPSQQERAQINSALRRI